MSYKKRLGHKRALPRTSRRKRCMGCDGTGEDHTGRECRECNGTGIVR